MKLDTIYKRTRTGAIQIWYKEIDGDSHRTVSGQQGGGLVYSGWKTASPKNVGKANETTAEEQAALECDAEYKKKLEKDYFKSVEEIDDETPFKPMLAEDYQKYPFSDWQDVFSQPKLDGARCIAKASGLWTRQGKEFLSVPHVSEDLKLFFKTFPNAILDGELYAHKDVNFNEIMSLIKKKNPSAENLAESKKHVQYHVYDYPSAPGRFSMRTRQLKNDSLIFGSSIVLVETKRVSGQAELDFLLNGYLADGYEGQMIRKGSESYENRRTKDLLKRKEFQDQEYKIIEICEGEGNRSGMAGFIRYELGDGRTFKSGIRGNHGYCKQLLADATKYVGGEGTVRYFELTPDGIPRFPVTVQVFEGKRDI